MSGKVKFKGWKVQMEKGAEGMRKNGWILFLILLCVAFLVSCGKKTEPDLKDGELVKTETEWDDHRSFL